MNTLKPGVEPPPSRLKRLPIHHGYPVPWFVKIIDGQPDFRIADHLKLLMAIDEHLCWICGEPLGRYQTFVFGPIAAINRISAEPPSHIECARYAARNCPYMTNSQVTRRQPDQLDKLGATSAGQLADHNPGCWVLWTTKEELQMTLTDGILFIPGKPETCEWYASGKPATRDVARDALERGVSILVAGDGSRPDTPADTNSWTATQSAPPDTTKTSATGPTTTSSS